MARCAHIPLNASVPPEQVAGVDLARHVGQLVAPAVGDDEVAAGLERSEVARDLEAEELGGAERRLIHEHGHAPGLDALHDALGTHPLLKYRADSFLSFYTFSRMAH